MGNRRDYPGASYRQDTALATGTLPSAVKTGSQAARLKREPIAKPSTMMSKTRFATLMVGRVFHYKPNIEREILITPRHTKTSQ